MKTLNRVPELLTDFNITAGTDITGFGPAGHLVQMARASKVSLEIDTASLPTLDGALDLLRAEVLNRAHRTNLRYVEKEVDFGTVRYSKCCAKVSERQFLYCFWESFCRLGWRKIGEDPPVGVNWMTWAPIFRLYIQLVGRIFWGET